MNRNLQGKEAWSTGGQAGFIVGVSAESTRACSQSQKVKHHYEQHYAGQADHGVPSIKILKRIFKQL